MFCDVWLIILHFNVLNFDKQPWVVYFGRRAGYKLNKINTSKSTTVVNHLPVPRTQNVPTEKCSVVIYLYILNMLLK